MSKHFPFSLEELLPSSKISSKFIRLIKNDHKLEIKVIELTNFLLGERIEIRERILCIQSGVTKQHICLKCGEYLRSTRKQGGKISYPKYCSTKCSKNSNEVIEKIKQTCLDRYGVENPFQVNEFKQKTKQTNLDRYGVENPSFSKEIRQKRVFSCIERYGVEHWTQTKMPRKSLELLQNHDWLYDRYVNNRVPALYIARELGLPGHKTVCQYLIKYGIPIRHDGWYSKKSIEWLTSLMLVNNIYIRHAENDGEYWIPELRFFVDGFCRETNKVYEFHGDVFHGNPLKFQDHKTCHPFDKTITAKELYDQTIIREQKILSLGYNLEVIWEHDWDTKKGPIGPF